MPTIPPTRPAGATPADPSKPASMREADRTNGEWHADDASPDDPDDPDDRAAMRRDDRGFGLTIPLSPGRSYRYEFLVDGRRWEADPAAPVAVPNPHGSVDSVIDLGSGRSD